MKLIFRMRINVKLSYKLIPLILVDLPKVPKIISL